MSLKAFKYKNYLTANSKTTSAVSGLGNTKFEDSAAFDKRYPLTTSKTGKLEKVDENTEYMNHMAKMLGSSSPYYKIGEITWLDSQPLFSMFGQNAFGNMVRAIANPIEKALSLFGIDKVYQEGVVIDGFGTISGSIDVKFTENPVLFVGSSISDGRFRTPNTVQMHVYVSNYYNNSGIGKWMDNMLSGDDTQVWSTFTKNLLLYSGNTRAQQALYNLRELQETGRPFTLYTPHGKYENMLIESIKPVTNDQNVDTLECDITFKEMIMYEVYRTDGNTISIPSRQNVGNMLSIKSLTDYTKKAGTYTSGKLTDIYNGIKGWMGNGNKPA